MLDQYNKWILKGLRIVPDNCRFRFTPFKLSRPYGPNHSFRLVKSLTQVQLIYLFIYLLVSSLLIAPSFQKDPHSLDPISVLPKGMRQLLVQKRWWLCLVHPSVIRGLAMPCLLVHLPWKDFGFLLRCHCCFYWSKQKPKDERL